MKRLRPDRITDYLQHMIDAIDRAMMHTQGFQSREGFEKNLMASDAVVRCIEIIGEAATKITKSNVAFASTHESLPWEAMSTMRNKLIHDYFEVDYEVVWQTVKHDLPMLRVQIVELLNSLHMT
jgi:uncharacterized protein with HEPN domain